MNGRTPAERILRQVFVIKFVTMLQDGVSRDDVQFYTEIDAVDCEDRRHVNAMQFRKPVQVHPIRYTLDEWAAVANLKKCYREAFDDRGDCRGPFVVFCSAVCFAKFLVEVLRREAELVRRERGFPEVDGELDPFKPTREQVEWERENPAIPEENIYPLYEGTIVRGLGVGPQEEGPNPWRVQGTWGENKETASFAKAFRDKPNDASGLVDVIVCTSVVGAGFSIDKHFHCFHGFLWSKILDFNEGNQFIRRLRMVIEDLCPRAVRQSYLYIEKGSGRQADNLSVLSDFNTVRQQLLTQTTAECVLGDKFTNGRPDYTSCTDCSRTPWITTCYPLRCPTQPVLNAPL